MRPKRKLRLVTPEVAFQRISGFAEKHGVTLRSVRNFTGCQSIAVFADMGINYARREILYLRKGLKRPYYVMMLIHELAHILASRLPPEKSKEQDFFGWEIQVARRLGLMRYWCSTVLHSYQAPLLRGVRRRVSQLTHTQRRRYFTRAVMLGRKYGNIDVRGNPKAVR